MREFHRCPICFGLVAIAALAASGARADTNVVQAYGDFAHYEQADYSPVPVCYDAWTYASSEEVEQFHAGRSVVDPYCVFAWTTHGGPDGLRYEGSWPENEQSPHFWHSVWNTCALHLTLEVMEETRLSAERAVLGDLVVNEHTITVTLPDGSDVVLLGEGGPDQGELVLSPGTHGLRLHVDAQTRDNHHPYTGVVSVSWVPTHVATHHASWSEVKARFR